LTEVTALGSDAVGFKPPVGITAECILTLPDGDGSSGQVMKTNGSKTLSWVSMVSAANSALSGTTTISAVASNPNTPSRLMFKDVDGAHTVSLRAPVDVATSYEIMLPPDDGAANQVLKTDGSGVTGWVDQAAAETTATVNALNITEVGALADGTIASGFGNIDNGSSTLDTGVATVASLVCTADATFGGGFGTTGATIATNGAITTDGTLASTGLIILGSASLGGYAKFYEGTNNGNNYIALRAPAAVTANTILYLPDGDGSANQIMKTDGSGNLSWSTGVGWHGSETRIKILAADFIGDDGGRPQQIDDSDEANENFFIKSYSSNPLYVTMPIPTGYTATHVMIYGSATDAIEVWEHQIDSKTGVSKGTGNVDTEIDIDDVASSTTNYLLIQVANASGNEIHGGYITIAES